MSLKQIHVMKDKKTGTWFGRLDFGAGDAFNGVRTQADAVKRATCVAKKEGMEVLVHRADNGAIRYRNSYGHDPRKNRG